MANNNVYIDMMGLIHKIKIFSYLLILFVFGIIIPPKIYGSIEMKILEEVNETDDWQPNITNKIVFYDLMFESLAKANQKKDSILFFKKSAFLYAEKKEAQLACNYIEKYIKTSLDISFIEDNHFDSIRNTSSYMRLSKKYKKQLDIWWMFFLYVGFIGVFVAIILNLRRRADRIGNFLISAFLLQHSIFIINISLLPTNYEFYFPNSLYFSTITSFMYGPLLYFYLKKVLFKHVFSAVDMLHLVPTIILIIVLFPIYNLSAEEKLWIMLNDKRPYITFLSDAKLVSLIVYMLLLVKVYNKLINREVLVSQKHFRWYRNIIVSYSIYTICYLVYDIFSIRRFIQDIPIHFLIVSIAFIILYISYTAFVYPSIFGLVNIPKPKRFDYSSSKYKKSGLTQALSLELKAKLLHLLNEEKIYRKNDINLRELSELLGTTRHNTSQIINEQFDLNFFELINKYRIEEAKMLLKNDRHKKVNIIQVAYEVGFNNKVTFNKSFKKYNKITPSEYVKS